MAVPSKVILFAAWLVLAGLTAVAVEESPAADFALLDDRTVQDQGGRTLGVQKPFERIISLYGAHTENLYSLGAGHRVVGVSRNETFPPEAMEKPVFSYHDWKNRYFPTTTTRKN